MTEQSALEQIEQEPEGPAYVYPDDAIKIVNTKDHNDKMQLVEGILQGTAQGTIVLHPDLAMTTFLVLCSDPAIMNRVFKFKNLTWQYVGEMFTAQRDQIIQEIDQATQRVQSADQAGTEASAYDLQLYVAGPYVRQAFPIDNNS